MLLFLLQFLALCSAAVSVSADSRRLVYVGSYSKSIPIYELSDNGEMIHVTTIEDPRINNPSWLTVDSTRSYLYAVSELDDSDGGGSVSAYRIADGGTRLEFLNQVPSHGSLPCHMAIDSSGKHLYISNYGGATLAVMQLQADGRLGEMIQLIDHDASTGAHVHEAVLDEATGVMQVMDLGLSEIFQYRYDSLSGTLTAPADQSTTVIRMAEGSGPRHIVNHPFMNISLVVSELDNSLSCLSYNRSSGAVGTVLATASSLRPGESATGMAAAEVQLSSDGAFAYVSNRDVSDPNQRRSSIAVFKLSSAAADSCVLSPVQHVASLGIHPRHFDLTYSAGNGQLMVVANRDSNNIVTFRVNTGDGTISQQGNVLLGETLVAPTQVLILDMTVH